MNTVLFVNATIGFSENLFLVLTALTDYVSPSAPAGGRHIVIVVFLENATTRKSLCVCVCVCVYVCFCMITQELINLGTPNWIML